MLTFNHKNKKPEKKTVLQYDRRGLILTIENENYRLISKTKMITRYAAVTKCCKMYGEELGYQEYFLIEEQDEKGLLYRQLISSSRENWIED